MAPPPPPPAQLAAIAGQLPTTLNIAILLVLAFVVWRLGLVIYRLTSHPLARFPGPKHYAVSTLPYAYKNHLLGQFGHAARDLHRKYGPVVRIAPNRLMVDGAVGWQDVFMHKPGRNLPEFGKEARSIGPEAEKSLLGAPTREAHRRQRRQLAHGFSEAAIYEQEPIISYYVDLFVRRLSENSKGGKPLDLHQWLNYLTFDIIGDLAMSESFGSLESSDYHPWVQNLIRTFQGIKKTLFFIESGIGALAFLDPGGHMKQLRKNNEYAFRKALARVEQGVEPVMPNVGVIGPDGKPKMQVRRDLVSYQMRKTSDGGDGLTADEIRVNSITLIGAGSDTTGTNLSTLFFQLSRPVNRRYFDAVTAEVRSSFRREADLTLRSVQSNALPLLHACIEESLRLHPPLAELATRISPGGYVDGKWVAPGTQITLYQNATFHNPDNFLEPDKWQPERFLPEGHPMYDPRFKAHDNFAIFKPFSAGPRDCIGKNLAYAEMRLVASRILLRFDLELDPSTKETWLEDQYIQFIWIKDPLFIRQIGRASCRERVSR